MIIIENGYKYGEERIIVMKNQNIFLVSKSVSGDSMIGYGKYLDELWDLVNLKNNISITGVRKTGKTSLLKEIATKYEKNYGSGVFIYVDMGLCSTFEEFCNLLEKGIKRIFTIHHDWCTDKIRDSLLALNVNDYISYVLNLADIFKLLK